MSEHERRQWRFKPRVLATMAAACFILLGCALYVLHLSGWGATTRPDSRTVARVFSRVHATAASALEASFNEFDVDQMSYRITMHGGTRKAIPEFYIVVFVPSKANDKHTFPIDYNVSGDAYVVVLSRDDLSIVRRKYLPPKSHDEVLQEIREFVNETLSSPKSRPMETPQ